MANFLLPLSGTSTHKSVNPSKLTIQLSSGDVEYDGSSAVTVNVAASAVNAANITSTSNAVAYFTDSVGTFASKASANGALYATSANGALQWGTLPVAQGGTGATTAANALTNLGALPTAGGIMTGNISRYYASSGTSSPMITALSSNQNIYIWLAGHGSSATATTASNHYKLLYEGTGASPNNYLKLIASSGTTDTVAYRVDEAGNVTFTKPVVADITGKAVQDGNGDTITSTYVKLESIDTTITSPGEAGHIPTTQAVIDYVTDNKVEIIRFV